MIDFEHISSTCKYHSEFINSLCSMKIKKVDSFSATFLDIPAGRFDLLHCEKKYNPLDAGPWHSGTCL